MEKLLGLEMPDRVKWIRVMLGELQRINSHVVWLGTHAIDIGAMTVFFYCFREREEILSIFEFFAGCGCLPATSGSAGSRGTAARLPRRWCASC